MKQLQSKDINFLRMLQPVQQAKQKGSKKGLLVIPPLLMLILGIGAWGLLQWQHWIYVKQTDTCAKQIEDIKTDAQYIQAREAEEKLAALQEKVKEAQLVRDALDSYPMLTGSLFETIQQCAGETIEITGYSYNAVDGLFIISGKAQGISDAAVFVGKLRVSGIYATLGYTGHFLDLTDEEAPGYVFDASGALRGKGADADE